MVDILKIGPHRIGRGATQQLSLALTINLIESVVIVAHIWNGRLSITIFSFRAWPDALVSRNKWPTYGVREGIFHPPVAEAATQATPRMNKKKTKKESARDGRTRTRDPIDNFHTTGPLTSTPHRRATPSWPLIFGDEPKNQYRMPLNCVGTLCLLKT